MTQSLFERLIRAVIVLVGRLFYPRIVRIGQLPDGPVVLAANHPNGLLDGLALILAIKRPLAFLAKSTFFANPIMRLVLHAFGAVPIYRPGDVGKPGGPSANSGSANTVTFAAAHVLLRQGGVLAVFPEGTPNPGPALLPLKTGVARIGLGAEAEYAWKLDLRVVPVGLWFEDQTRPGTAAVVLIGQPIVVAELREASQRHPEGAVRALTAQLQGELGAAVMAAQEAGEQLEQAQALGLGAARAPGRGVGSARQAVGVLLLALGALPALVGHILALPGRAIAWVILQGLARRHRATVGTARLVALIIGLLAGWALLGLVLGSVYAWEWGLAVLIAGPLCGYIGLRMVH